MSNFASLKKSSGNLDKLNKALEQLNQNTQSNDSDDDLYWRPEVDKAGNGYAVVRFLPAPPQDGDDGIPWAKLYTHGFQGPGGWYIENSLTSINEKDPVSEYNSDLWNSGIEANKEVARKQKRRLTYISNVYIVEDPKHPENNGTIKLFKYGKKIFEKITDAMNPPPEFGEDPINPFDLWNGANFKLKIRKVDGFQNYDKSEFDTPGALLGGDDAKLEALWQREHSLKEILDPKHFKTYDELKVRLQRVLAVAPAPVNKTATVESAKPSPVASYSEPEVSTTGDDPDLPWGDDSDTSLDFFNSLANDD
jgi:gp32 DNA binding protein like